MQDSFKRWNSFSLILLQILTCHVAFSHGNKTIIDNEKKEIAKNVLENKGLFNNNFSHSFSFALEHAYYHYNEPDVYQNFVGVADKKIGARWVQWKGNTWGGSILYRLTWKEKIFVQPELRLLYGNHQYVRGAKEVIFNKTTHSIPSMIFEPRLTMGWNVQVNKNLIISPYSGIGYRFKSDDAEDIKTSKGHKLGFYRKSNYVYVPLGASAEYQIDNVWSFSLKGEYDLIVKAWHYSRTLTSGSKIFKQPNGYGLKGEAGLSYLYNKVKISLSPYLNYWNIRNSKEKDGGSMEPYNITWETGLKMGVTF